MHLIATWNKKGSIETLTFLVGYRKNPRLSGTYLLPSPHNKNPFYKEISKNPAKGASATARLMDATLLVGIKNRSDNAQRVRGLQCAKGKEPGYFQLRTIRHSYEWQLPDNIPLEELLKFFRNELVYHPIRGKSGDLAGLQLAMPRPAHEFHLWERVRNAVLRIFRLQKPALS